MLRMADADVAITAIVVCTISMSLLRSEWNLLRDMELCFFAIIAYLVWSYFGPKARVGNDSIRSKQCTEAQLDSNQVELMQKYASERNMGGVMRTFRSIQQSRGTLTSLMYNTVLRACVNCGNVQAAEDWMDEIKEAKVANDISFNILIKALVAAHALDKATIALKDMKTAGVQPSIANFNEVLGGFAREGRFNGAVALLEEMQDQGVHPNSGTLNVIVKLMNGSRDIDQSIRCFQRILIKYNLQANIRGDTSPRFLSLDSVVPVPVPCIAAVISQAQDAKYAPCAHEIHVTGCLPQIKAVRKTLKQLGFLDKTERSAWPLDGHWVTDHGLTVVIEGKIVRWSGQKASRLRYAEDRRACVLRLYGVDTHGQLESAVHALDAAKTLRWDNGDVWNAYEGRVIGQDTLFSQSMTKTVRDEMQDKMYRARMKATLNCVSKQSLGVPAILENTITGFLGNDLYYVRVNFESRWNPSRVADDELPSFESDESICDTISRRHPRVGLRHCWAELDVGVDCCGQRTLVNGEELDEDCFSRHVNAVTWA